MKVENLSGNPETEIITHIGETYRYLAKVGTMTPWKARMEADQQIRRIKLNQLTAHLFKN